MKRYLLGILVVGTLLLIGAGTGLAGGAVGAGSPVSDTVTLYNPDGSVSFTAGVTEADELLAGNAYYLGGSDYWADPAMFDKATALLEPNGDISDIFAIYQQLDANNTLHYYLAFESDDNEGSLQPPFFGTVLYRVPEGSGAIDVTNYLLPSWQTAGYILTFQSDAADSVPDPATMLLLGLGLMGLAGVRRKIQK